MNIIDLVAAQSTAGKVYQIVAIIAVAIVVSLAIKLRKRPTHRRR